MAAFMDDVSSSNGSMNSGFKVRHCGRAQIRGKIRRVWRPRYLELCDNGSVRYYEITNALGQYYDDSTIDYQHPPQQSQQHYHHEHIPKCTLQVYHARIIDVTTFRDLHVGLPKGTYGFVFHGQRHLHPDILACHPPEHVTPRDFLCAVGTLEEAQSWVVALQWASSCVQAQQFGPRSYSEIWIQHNNSNDHDDDDDDDIHDLVDDADDDDISEDMDGFASITSPTRNSTTICSTPKRRKQRNIMMSPTGNVRKFNTPSSSKRREKEQQQQQGKTVVTKVRNFRLIRNKNNSTNHKHNNKNPSWIQVGYEIRLLLLRTRGKKLIVEERSIVRTKHDFDTLLKEFQNHKDFARMNENEKSSTTTTTTTTKHTLNDFETYLKEIQIYLSSIYKINKSISIVDKMLRTLAMDATIINSEPMRTFWNMASSSSGTDNNGNSGPSSSETTKSTSKTKPLNPTKKSPQTSKETDQIISIQTYALSSHLNTDEMVKQWLLKDPQSSIRGKGGRSIGEKVESYVVYMLQNPLYVTGLLGILLLGFPFLIRQYQIMFVNYTMEVRIDNLIFSYILMVCIGRLWGERVATSKIPTRTSSNSREHQKQGSIKDSTAILTKKRKSQTVQKAVAPEEEEACITGSTSTDDDEAFASDESTASGVSSLPSPSALESPTEERKKLASPLPEYPANNGESCWSKPQPDIFRVRGKTYLTDRIKIPSAPQPFDCLGVDIWLSDNPERHIARHPSVLGGKLGEVDTFVVNFLLPFGNFVSYFAIPPLEKFPPNLAQVWGKFLAGDQQYRDARLKLLPVVVDGPWIVKKAVGSGTSPALLGKVIPLQYYFKSPDKDKKGIYEVDVIVSASRIGNGILSVVKGHTNTLTIAFAFIIEAAEEEELPETALCTFQMHSIHLEDCPQLPEYNLDEL